MSLYAFARPLLFRLPAERAHRLTIDILRRLPHRTPSADDPILATTLAGLDLPNPIGLAAGFDKDGEVPDAMLALGFGFVEVGTLTPRPQEGNPKPRMFRLAEDRAVINRLGFNNGGQKRAKALLSLRDGRPGVVGVNIGANKDSHDRILDYAWGVAAMAPHAQYLTVNISSPNTPGLRALQSKEALTELVGRVLEARGKLKLPVFVKLAPDLEPQDIADIADIALATKISGLIVSNTTITRPDGLKSGRRGETGGLSGAPLKPLALERLTDVYRATGGKVPLIGAGGIASGADAYARIRAGASAVQLYTGLAYEGPGLVKRIKRELAALLRADGFKTVKEAVGVDVSA